MPIGFPEALGLLRIRMGRRIRPALPPASENAAAEARTAPKVEAAVRGLSKSAGASEIALGCLYQGRETLRYKHARKRGADADRIHLI